MPKRDDIKSILVIGAGPIVIGQACEFDYSGTQACLALKEAGYRVILVNSNPATIMTDEHMADATYIVPINPKTVAQVIEKEKPDALLPTVGGQTALNCALGLVELGVLKKHQVELLSVTPEAIECAEDRQKFAEAVKALGFSVPNWGLAHNLAEAWRVVETIGYPVIIRPSFTLGGTGGGIAYNVEEFQTICERGFSLAPSLLIDQSIIGWKEYELELIRDANGNGIVVCSIENLDPMGVHTGDSITVAPAQTLMDKEYQCLRDAALKILARIGINSGGANVQFSVNPDNGDWVVIEMNPRVSRSSALASKATGFAIAAIATKLAIGYTLDELNNGITYNIPAAFEPSLDYVVTKIPRFNFEKFPETDSSLTTQMKSVGEVMAIGRTFQESLQKALRSLEIGVSGLDPKVMLGEGDARVQIEHALQNTPWDRIWYVADAFRFGLSIEEIYGMCHIDPWFLRQIEDLVETERKILDIDFSQCDRETLWQLKRKGFSDQRLASLWDITEETVRDRRWAVGVHPVYKRVDSCAGEFDTSMNYLYSTYEPFCESRPTNREKIMILGGGPNRIGQGIEFDYCCVHAAMALKETYETIMVNCNPETVSTDYNISDRLYFEPVTLENVLDIVHLEKPKGVVIQYGGQTPLKLANALSKAGVPIVGTQPEAIQLAEDRERFSALADSLGLRQPPGGIVRCIEEGLRLSRVLAYPLIVRPSYVLGGRAMEVIYTEEDFTRYLRRSEHISAETPLLLDHFLDGAIEIDVDAICDGDNVLVCGIMEHIEQAGVHSGDSACCLPAHSLSQAVQDEVTQQMTQLAKAIGVVGLMNAQFAYLDEELFILEVNPRASRTVPFVAKTMGIPLAKVAAKCMLGQSLVQQGITSMPDIPYKAVKRPVFPFAKFPGVDPILGPEMRSTGEVMGLGATFGEAFYQSTIAAGDGLPQSGCAFVSVRDGDKAGMVPVAKELIKQGFSLIATHGTANYLQDVGVLCQAVNKVTQGRPHIVDMIKNGQVDLIINTTQGVQAIADSFTIRRSAVLQQVCYTTTLAEAQAFCAALVEQAQFELTPLQQLYQKVGETS